MIKFGYFHPNQRRRANPGNQSQRESAVTMRPPSSIPTGVRLKRLRKYPNHASAIKSGAAKNSPKTLQTKRAKPPQHGAADTDACFYPRITWRFLECDERTHKRNKDGRADFESEL